MEINIFDSYTHEGQTPTEHLDIYIYITNFFDSYNTQFTRNTEKSSNRSIVRKIVDEK